MELEWKEPIIIPDGKHTGEIVKIVYRDEPYEYTDIVIKIDGIDIELKYGCPTILSEGSKLGRLMQMFGVEAKSGTKINPETALVNKKVEFMTLMKKNKDGREYAEVVADSIKPVKIS